MSIIKRKNFKEFWEKRPDSKQVLLCDILHKINLPVRNSDMKCFNISLIHIQPSQPYLAHEKLLTVKQYKLQQLSPLPVKQYKDSYYLTDGHTRCYELYLRGYTSIEVYMDEDELNENAYWNCVELCRKKGIISISDLAQRIIPFSKFKTHWIDFCQSQVW